jgi:M6 family metalloprotease-like protein
MLRLFIILFVLIVLFTPTLAHTPGTTQEGYLSVIHWTPQPGSNAIADNLYLLTFDDGHKLQLEIARPVIEAGGGLHQLKDKRVQVTLDELGVRTMQENGSRVRINAIQAIGEIALPREAQNQSLISGAQPWATILCEFPGDVVGHQSKAVNHFQKMYEHLDGYWREQSFGKVNLQGSQAFGWFPLPKPQTYYFPTPGDLNDTSAQTLSELASDCINAADSSVDFSSFVGINLMFNGQLNCCAWGGSDHRTIDGVTRSWRLTWNPAWSWRDVHVVAHEIGHGFGMPHANNYDNDNSPYDNPWDVMSDSWYRCFEPNNPNLDTEYGCTGQHTGAYQKDSMGWFDSDRRLVATSSTGIVNLDHVAMQNAHNYQIIVIPVAGSSVRYVVEARQNAGYDAKVPGKAVLIYEVDESRLEPAWLVGAFNDGLSQSVTNTTDGAWVVGETFAGPNFMVSIVGETGDGFQVSVTFDESNLVMNGSMESNANGIPDGWAGKGLAGDKVRCNTADRAVSQSQNCAFVFKGSEGEKSSISQSVNLMNRAFVVGNTLTFAGFANASSAATKAKVKLIVLYADGTKDKKSVNLSQTSGYQLFNGTLTLTQSTITEIKIQVQNKSAGGKLFVDSLSLRAE